MAVPEGVQSKVEEPAASAPSDGSSAKPGLESMSLYLRLVTYLRPYWFQFGASIVALVIVALTQPALAALFKPMLDGSFIEKDPATVRWVPIALIGLFLLRGVFGFISEVAMQWVTGRLVLDLRMEMFGHLMSLPSSFFDHNPKGRIISRLTYDVNQVTRAATNVLTVLVRDILTVVGLLFWMFYLNWLLALISLVVLPAIIVIIRKVTKRIRRISRRVQDTVGTMTHILDETTEGNRIVKIFTGQAYESKRFFKTANQLRRFLYKNRVASAASVPMVQTATAVGLAIIVYVAATQATADALSVGEFVSFFGAMAMLSTPVKHLTKVVEPLQNGLAAAESIFGFLDLAPEADQGGQALDSVRGEVEYRHVNMTYASAERPAVRDVSFILGAGETVALVGASGSGKSTLANLLPRFYDQSSGVILLDGVDTRALPLDLLRSEIAYVGQEVVLFNDTVRANIAYGSSTGATDEDIMDAARRAHATGFIDELPEGFDTYIGDRGVRLSGGQRQRLGIARAILKNAPVLILDEATSALDTETERQVQSALDELRAGRTTLVIAHRLSTIENADRIVVLELGEVIETGTHAELIARNGVYAELHRIQFSTQRESRDGGAGGEEALS